MVLVWFLSSISFNKIDVGNLFKKHRESNFVNTNQYLGLFYDKNSTSLKSVILKHQHLCTSICQLRGNFVFSFMRFL